MVLTIVPPFFYGFILHTHSCVSFCGMMLCCQTIELPRSERQQKIFGSKSKPFSCHFVKNTYTTNRINSQSVGWSINQEVIEKKQHINNISTTYQHNIYNTRYIVKVTMNQNQPRGLDDTGGPQVCFHTAFELNMRYVWFI